MFRLRSRTRELASGTIPEFASTCWVCGRAGRFAGTTANTRGSFKCPSCRAQLRYQGQAAVLVQRYSRNGASSLRQLAKEREFARLDIYEPGVLGPFRRYLRRLPNYVESQYSPDVARGSVVDGTRYEDLMQLSFPDSSLDVVITSDVFEHVRKPRVAFTEVHRVLRPGGVHVFTVPLSHPMPAQTVARVDTSGDEDIHVLEPRYHNETHLVYNDFGADLLDELDAIGLATDAIRFECTDPVASRLLTLCSVKRAGAPR